MDMSHCEYIVSLFNIICLFQTDSVSLSSWGTGRISFQCLLVTLCEFQPCPQRLWDLEVSSHVFLSRTSQRNKDASWTNTLLFSIMVRRLVPESGQSIPEDGPGSFRGLWPRVSADIFKERLNGSLVSDHSLGELSSQTSLCFDIFDQERQLPSWTV